MRKLVSFMLVLMATAGLPGAAQARTYRGPPVVIIEPPDLAARGCYFYRGERRCGSYCYVEVNGHRYCQVREREAFPQAELWLDEPIDEPDERRGAAHGRRGVRLK